VIVTRADQTALFAPQNQRTSEWLHRRCGLTAESICSDTKICVHPRKYSIVIADLRGRVLPLLKKAKHYAEAWHNYRQTVPKGTALGLVRRFAKTKRKCGQRSRRRRNLAARELDPILRIKPFECSAEAALEQISHFRAEQAADDEQFQIGNAALLVFRLSRINKKNW
jgi:hypothetical protein